MIVDITRVCDVGIKKTQRQEFLFRLVAKKNILYRKLDKVYFAEPDV